jgi:hypothetical protein
MNALVLVLGVSGLVVLVYAWVVSRAARREQAERSAAPSARDSMPSSVGDDTCGDASV